MNDCPLCGGKTVPEEMDQNKEERLRKHNEHLEGSKVVKDVCESCGHVSYVKK